MKMNATPSKEYGIVVMVIMDTLARQETTHVAVTQLVHVVLVQVAQ